MRSAYENSKVVVKVAGLGMSVEEVDNVPTTDQDLHIEHTFVREGIAHHSVVIRLKIGLYNGEPRQGQ